MPNCCPNELKPVNSGYHRKNLAHYIAIPKDNNNGHGIVVVPDIFGNHPNAYQLCDILASEGYHVVMPDYFGAEGPFSADNFPPPNGFDKEPWLSFQARITKFDEYVEMMQQGINLMRGLGVKGKIGGMGMCWGAKVVVVAMQKGLVDVGVSPHPSFVTADDGAKVKKPYLMMPASDDPDFEPILAEFQKSCPASKMRRFDQLKHGYLGARGTFASASDYSNEETAKAAQEALNTALVFFKENMK